MKSEKLRTSLLVILTLLILVSTFFIIVDYTRNTANISFEMITNNSSYQLNSSMELEFIEDISSDIVIGLRSNSGLALLYFNQQLKFQHRLEINTSTVFNVKKIQGQLMIATYTESSLEIYTIEARSVIEQISYEVQNTSAVSITSDRIVGISTNDDHVTLWTIDNGINELGTFSSTNITIHSINSVRDSILLTLGSSSNGLFNTIEIRENKFTVIQIYDGRIQNMNQVNYSSDNLLITSSTDRLFFAFKIKENFTEFYSNPFSRYLKTPINRSVSGGSDIQIIGMTSTTSITFSGYVSGPGIETPHQLTQIQDGNLLLTGRANRIVPFNSYYETGSSFSHAFSPDGEPLYSQLLPGENIISTDNAMKNHIVITNDNLTLIIDEYTDTRGDLDNDGVPNGYEIQGSADPADNDDSYHDPDEDGVGNIIEYTRRTLPNDPDTDADTIDDRQEIFQGTNPLVNDLTNDTDLDGIPNYQEYQLGLNPGRADTDHDGKDDRWELNNGYNPTNSLSNPYMSQLIALMILIPSLILSIAYREKIKAKLL